MRYQRIGLGVLVSITLAAAGVTQAADAEKFTFVAVSPPSMYMLPIYCAEEEGYYKTAGLELEIKTVSGDQNGLRAIVTGAGQATIIGAPILYEAVIHGAKAKGVGGGSQVLTDYYMVMAKGKGGSLKDAANKTIAISNPGSMPQLIPEMMFDKAGIDASKSKYVPIGGYSARLQAVVAGKADATLIDSLTAFRGEKEGLTKIIAGANEVLGQPLGYTFTVVPEDELHDAAKRKPLDAFVKQTMRGARFIADHPDKAAQIMGKQLKGTVPADVLKETVDKLNELKVWGLNGGVERDLHDYTMKAYLKYHAISKAVDYTTAFDPGPADKALAELGKREGWH